MFRSYFTAAAIALAATSTVGVGAAVVEKSLRGRNADTVASANKHHHRVLQEEEEFTFLIADIQYEDGFTATSRKLQGNSGNKNPNRPERTMNVQDAEGMIYEIEAGSGDTAGTSSGSKVTLPDKASMTPGTNKINLNGGGLKKKTKKEKKEKRDLQEDDSSTELRRHLTAIGTKTVVAVRVIASGGAYNWTDEAGLSDDVFGTNGDAYNLKTGFEGCSHNQLMINPGGEGRSDINNGVTTINVDVNATSGNHGNMANAVTAAIKAKFGVNDPTEIADHWLYCLPPGVTTSIAYAYTNHYMSVYSNEWCNYPSSQMHELGHNFGFDHSNEGTQDYGDQSGMMGSSYSEDEGPLMCFNAAKSWQTGWFNEKRVNMNIGGSEATDNCLETDITGQADYVAVDTTQTILVKMNRASSLGRDLFLMYNKKTGVNSGTAEGGNTVMVVEAGAEGTGYAESWLMGKLGAGQSQTFAGYLGDDRDLVITVLSIGDTAQVKIEFDGLCTNTIAPTPSPCENPNQKQVSVQIATDTYPAETSWTLKKVGSCAGQADLNLSSPTYSTANAVQAAFEQCVDKGQYEFTITDAYGDGMCCSYGAGSFQVFYGDRDVFEGQSSGDFGASFTGNFGECDVPASPPPTPAPVNSTPPPTPAPVNPPTSLPTTEPTNPPSPLPTNPPSPNPTAEPTNPPPTNAPTNPPTPLPSSPPSPAPTNPPVAVAAVDKYICTKNAPLPATICADGSLAGGSCSTANAPDGCGNGGKVCWWSSCPGDGGGPPPTPTPPPPSPPTGGCPVCAATGGPCCGTCVDGGKPSSRGCFE